MIICLYNFVFKFIFADVENRKALPDRYAEGEVEPSIHRGCLHDMGQLTPELVHSGCCTGTKILLVSYRSCEMKQ